MLRFGETKVAKEKFYAAKIMLFQNYLKQKLINSKYLI